MEPTTNQAIISRAWGIAGKQRLFWMGIFIIFILADLVVHKLFFSYSSGDFHYQLVLGLVNAIVGAIFAAAIVHMSLKAVRGEMLTINDLVERINLVPQLFVGSIFYGLAVVAGIILLIIPGIYIAIHWGFFRFAMVEKNMGIFEAFKESGRLTQGKKLRILGFGLLIILMNIAGAILFGVGLLWTVPASWVAEALYYRVLEEESTGSSVLMEPTEKTKGNA